MTLHTEITKDVLHSAKETKRDQKQLSYEEKILIVISKKVPIEPETTVQKSTT